MHLGHLAERWIAEEDEWEKRRAKTYDAISRVLDKVEDFRGMLPSVSYAPFEGISHPDVDNIPQIEKIRADLKRYIVKETSRRPLIMPVILEV